MPSSARLSTVGQMQGDRTIRFANAPNLRDVGGPRTQDGRWVRKGLAFRSDELNNMDRDDLANITELGVRAVVDLRYAAERRQRPDPPISGTRSIVADMLADGNYGADALRPKEWALIRRGDSNAIMLGMYREMIEYPSANKAIGSLIRLLATERAPVLFHCTSGKDRTGWATAVLLTALGVPRAEVMRDYLLSNNRLKEKNARDIAALVKNGDGTILAEQWQPLYSVRADYLQAAFDEVDRRYGSFEAYRRDGLGINDLLLQRLQAKFLIGTRLARHGPRACSRRDSQVREGASSCLGRPLFKQVAQEGG